MLTWSSDEIQEAETKSLILRMQCPISPEEVYWTVYRLGAMTLPRNT